MHINQIHREDVFPQGSVHAQPFHSSQRPRRFVVLYFLHLNYKSNSCVFVCFFFHFPNMKVCSIARGPRPPTHPPMKMSSSFSAIPIPFPPLGSHCPRLPGGVGTLLPPLLRVQPPSKTHASPHPGPCP